MNLEQQLKDKCDELFLVREEFMQFKNQVARIEMLTSKDTMRTKIRRLETEVASRDTRIWELTELINKMKREAYMLPRRDADLKYDFRRQK